MAKPNLTSIFTSTNQYSVLKLLKALCDAVDNIDYTDNTEFTNFKEQVNTAVASLTSTDNSLQEQIDNNNGLINDVSTQVSVIERPDANTTVVNKGITVKDNGDVTVSRNLEVGGTTKLNNGFEFIHTYPVSSTQNINIMFEEPLDGLGYYGFVGILSPSDSIGVEYLCIGTYLEVGAPYKVVSLMFIDNSDLDKLKYAKGNADGNALAVSNVTPDVSTLQPKLYRHVLSLSNNSYMYSGYIVYISTSNLKVNSLEGLTTLLNPSKNYIYPLTGICTGLDTRDAIQFGNKNLYLKSFDKISYENNTWYFKDEYGDTEEFDSVSDTVTPL